MATKKPLTDKQRQKIHNRKHTLLRRMCYRFVRDMMPDVWEQMRQDAGMRPLLKKKRRKRGR